VSKVKFGYSDNMLPSGLNYLKRFVTSELRFAFCFTNALHLCLIHLLRYNNVDSIEKMQISCFLANTGRMDHSHERKENIMNAIICDPNPLFQQSKHEKK
jgi:hypothetical protein